MLSGALVAGGVLFKREQSQCWSGALVAGGVLFKREQSQCWSGGLLVAGGVLFKREQSHCWSGMSFFTRLGGPKSFLIQNLCQGGFWW